MHFYGFNCRCQRSCWIVRYDNQITGRYIMKWQEAIDKIDKSTSNTVSGDFSLFGNMFNLYSGPKDWDAFDARFKGYWIYNWICWDTHVVLRAYFLDGKAVAISTQNARKNEEIVQFVSIAAAEEMRQFIASMTEEDTKPIIDLNEEIDSSWFENTNQKYGS